MFVLVDWDLVGKGGLYGRQAVKSKTVPSEGRRVGGFGRDADHAVDHELVLAWIDVGWSRPTTCQPSAVIVK